MIAYQSGYAPVYSRRISPVRLAQGSPTPSAASSGTDSTLPKQLTPGLIRTVMTGGLVIETGLGAAGTWVGLYTGQHATGVLKVLGYVVGIVSGVSGIVSLAELVLYLVRGLPVPEVPAGPAVQQPAVPISK